MTDAGERTALGLPGRRTAGGRARPVAEAPGARRPSCATLSAATPSSAKPCATPGRSSHRAPSRTRSWPPSSRSRPAVASPRSRAFLPRAGSQPASGGRNRRRRHASPRWRSSRSSAPALHRDPSRRTSRPLRRRAVVAQNADEPPATSCRPVTSQPAFVPATRLTNYVVAHSEYSSPLGAPLGPDRRARGRRWRPGRRDGRRRQPQSPPSSRRRSPSQSQ